MPEPAVLRVHRAGADASVVARLLPGKLYFPHSLTLAPDGASFMVTDHLLDVALRVDAATGAELARYGASWSLDAFKRSPFAPDVGITHRVCAVCVRVCVFFFVCLACGPLWRHLSALHFA
jgi:sugar lactone lactonase YvrE